MSHSQEVVSLPEADYNAVLDVTTRLLSHKTTRSLASLFRSHLLPLLDASACFYGWADADFFRPQIMDAIDIAQSDLDTIQAYFPYCPLAQQMVDQSSLVETYDLGIPRTKLQNSVAKFFGDHPAYKRSDSSYLDDIRTILLTTDLSEPAIVVGFHRLKTCQEPFTQRETRILEFVRPHLCEAIKNLALKEGLIDRISTAEGDPLESSIPVVQVTKDSMIVHQNPKFRELFNFGPGENLGASLARFLERKIIDYEKFSNSEIPETEFFWYCLCPNLFQVSITRGDDDLWLLRLHPMRGACPGSNPLLEEYGLTPKEKEVCCAVRQGFDNREIASQLFISYHTAKTHLKNIYRKLKIPSRPRLVSFLNQK